ncbi:MULTISPECIES: WcbI family polysaccharide biosynthesis putative acetyltransferase [unclassified Methylobacterium]|uniref:WcbI family polysaccharide biosynthesis putative acetyltransferase n=1 Tax=unclassified Methylobacterium TaxID=2615210 RepID=UPI0036F6D70B
MAPLQRLFKPAAEALGATSFSGRSWARPWRQPAGRPRIAVIGNCQATGVAQSLRLLLPAAEVETILLAGAGRRFGTVDRLAPHLQEHDFVFSHFFPVGFLAGGNVHALAARVPALRLFPTILFSGFHPDLVHVGDEASLRLSRLVPSPIGAYHSAIALQAFRRGLSVDAALRMFDGPVFERLGYFDHWEASAAYLLRTARDVGFGLEREFARWSRGGIFMHVINHPRLTVLADIARRLAREAGCDPLDIPVEAYAPDALAAEPVWPVLPAIAERYGVAASTLFKGDGRRGPPRLLDLPDFVAESFALYARHRPDDLGCSRVTAWEADAGIGALFDEAA